MMGSNPMGISGKAVIINAVITRPKKAVIINAVINTVGGCFLVGNNPLSDLIQSVLSE
jgi:hypothetical protein